MLSIVTELEGQLAAARAELGERESYMRPDSAPVRQLRARVTALSQQVKDERARLANESGADLTRLIEGYEPLQLDHQLAQQRYSSALTSLELARADASVASALLARR